MTFQWYKRSYGETRPSELNFHDEESAGPKSWYIGWLVDGLLSVMPPGQMHKPSKEPPRCLPPEGAEQQQNGIRNRIKGTRVGEQERQRSRRRKSKNGGNN